jgi:5-methylcytosine-specific restriction endonuclease McrA
MIDNPLAFVETSALTARLYDLRKQERALLVEFLQYLAEMERRRAHVDAGFPSLYAFLTQHLGYSNAAAYRRMKAAQLLIRFPAIAPYLADGRLGLTTLVELRDVLEDATHRQTLDRAAGKTEEEVKQLVAALAPRAAPPDLVRRLPRRDAVTPTGSAVPPAPPPAPPRPPRVEPISAELHTIRVTVGREFIADLKAVKALLSHVIPDGNLEKVLHDCLRRARRELERRRQGAAERPRAAAREHPESRYISRALLRAVHERDGGRCTYVGPTGMRCGSTHQLEVHHIVPFARGGETTLANVALTCSIHNAHFAEQDFGREHMAASSGRQLTLV